jgi:pyrimidine-nucleoside phosphorylase
MMSGRGLGHTGGTLDKLDSIPGYRTALSAAEFRDILGRDGFAMTGQTRDIVPADRLLYALRDVSGTVESIPLITASILSKKAAEGAEALVLDVKFGSGAFMKESTQGERLAWSLVETGTVLGMRVIALLTNMDEPLGNMVGNFLEVEESYRCLEGRGPDDLMEVTLELGARMAILGGKAKDPEEGKALCREALKSGRPRELFLTNIESQGANRESFLAMLGTFRSPFRGEVKAREDAYISRIDAWEVGHAGVTLGVGRNRIEDTVSPGAGLEFHRKSGALVRKGEPVMSVWAQDEESLKAALPALEAAVEYSPVPPSPRRLVLKEIGQW